GLEGMDDVLVSDMKAKGVHTGELGLLPEGGGWLLVEFGADTEEEADELARSLMAHLDKSGDAPAMKLYEDPAEERTVWEMRQAASAATDPSWRRPPTSWPTTAVRCRASTATASPAPSSCPRSTARSWCGPSPSSRPSGIPATR